MYLWLCPGIYPLSATKSKKKLEKHIRPNGELAVKYNLKEYRDLREAVLQLRARLNSGVETNKKNKEKDGDDDDDDGRIFSTADIEKVAYLLRHLDVSGFPDAAEILNQDKAQLEEADAAEEESNNNKKEGEILGTSRPRGKKRKRRNEEGTYRGKKKIRRAKLEKSKKEERKKKAKEEKKEKKKKEGGGDK